MTDTETTPIETWVGGVLTETAQETRPLTSEELQHRQIVAQWGQRREALIADYGALQAATPAVVAAYTALNAVTPAIVAANTAVQGSTSTTILANIKTYCAANLQALAALKDATNPAALGALKDATESTILMLGSIEDALTWLDAQFAELQDEG